MLVDASEILTERFRSGMPVKKKRLYPQRARRLHYDRREELGAGEKPPRPLRLLSAISARYLRKVTGKCDIPAVGFVQ